MKLIYKIKVALTLITPFIYQNSYSQLESTWGLNRSLGGGSFFIGYTHILPVNAKYSSKGLVTGVFNQVLSYGNLDISISGLNTSSYKYLGSQGMVIMIPVSQGVISPSGSNSDFRIHGSTSNYAKDYETDSDDNYLILADNKGNGWDPSNTITSSYNDSSQLLLCKVSLGNKILWHKIYGGSSAEYAISIRKTQDGNFMVLAQTQSADGDVTGYKGGKDIWLLKVNNADGKIMWSKTIGTAVDEIPTDMQILEDGSIVISGAAAVSSLFPSSHAGLNSFLLKLDENGQIKWAKAFGGDGDDVIKSFVPVLSGGFISIGSSTSNSGDYDINKGGKDVYIFSHDQLGNLIWKRNYGLPGDDIPGDIAFTPCDSMIYASLTGQNDYFDQEFPAYYQSVGIRVVLDANGIEKFYYKPKIYLNSEFSNHIVSPTIVAHKKKGILASTLEYFTFQNSGYKGKPSITFSAAEFGISAKTKNYDTSICRGEMLNGKIYTKDTAYSDTLRNSCQVDTLINQYKIHIKNADSSIVIKDTIVCYASVYKGKPVFNSFVQRDTIQEQTTCGPRWIISIKNIKVSTQIVNGFGKDSILCTNKTISLNAFKPAKAYLWQDNSNTYVYTALKPGLFWVEVTDTFNCKKRDSITIRTLDLLVTKIFDTTICKGTLAWGETFFIDTTYSDTIRNSCNNDALISNYRVHISNKDSLINKSIITCYGDTFNGLPVYTSFSTKDTAIVSATCGNSLIITTTSVNVTPQIINHFTTDSTLCNNQEIVLNAYSPAFSYLWNDNSTKSLHNVSSPGIYWIEVVDTFKCKMRQSINIHPSDLYLSIYSDTTISAPELVTLIPQTNGIVSWNPAATLSCTTCQNAIANPLSTTTYQLASSKNNCILYDTVKVSVNNNFFLYIPDAFTPNNDNLNDLFKIKTNYSGIFILEIYNRYGEKVFSEKNQIQGWNGMYKGKEQPIGNYTYKLLIQRNNNPAETKTGNILLLR